MSDCVKCGRRVSSGPGVYMKREGLAHRICPSRKHEPMKMGVRRPARRKQGCRGFGRNEIETARHGFKDSRSYVSLDDPPHLILYGLDKEPIREEIYKRDNGDCVLCGRPLTFQEMEWHHVRNDHNNYRRCDCAAGGITTCRECHEREEAWGVRLKSIPMEQEAT
jgi:hypothetical protein